MYRPHMGARRVPAMIDGPRPGPCRCSTARHAAQPVRVGSIRDKILTVTLTNPSLRDALVDADSSIGRSRASRGPSDGADARRHARHEHVREAARSEAGGMLAARGVRRHGDCHRPEAGGRRRLAGARVGPVLAAYLQDGTRADRLTLFAWRDHAQVPDWGTADDASAALRLSPRCRPGSAIVFSMSSISTGTKAERFS